MDAGRIKPVYPQKKWAVKKPDAVGLDVRKLDVLSGAEWIKNLQKSSKIRLVEEPALSVAERAIQPANI